MVHMTESISGQKYVTFAYVRKISHHFQEEQRNVLARSIEAAAGQLDSSCS